MTRRDWDWAALVALLVVGWASTSLLYPTTDDEQPHQAATIRILKEQEGFRGRCYDDGFGNLTIGYGTKLPLTEAEAAHLVGNRLARAESTLAAQWPPYGDQAEHVKQALALMAYQLGVSGELMFTRMFACLEREDSQCAAREVADSKWNQQTPKRVAAVRALLLSR